MTTKIRFEYDDEFTKCKATREVIVDDRLDEIIDEFRFFLIGLTWSETQIDKALEDAINPDIYNGN